ncbi:hypothetical protein QLQ12_06715 [Actinoplanes sp. NEAU-A12]|uniref:Uncharacterized protein n=1 Tax=Actinoplanes sandaracinus TaxID=3045177 RepID=A0ABT6WEZ9_9ACTN|nr:hypothetical protein [Actinoplanes sandaracinus]MDI6098293.1 hypothetical protein [Actinoplanes sandaracinus]
MADQQPGDTTPAAGMPGPTRLAGSGEPPTTVVHGRWSGAAVVPESAPRRSLWSRMVDRINGAGPAAEPGDDRTAIPAVDPWADQDTPAWPDAYTTPAATTPLPETRLDVPASTPPTTRLDIPGPAPAPPTRRDTPAATPAPPTRLDIPPATPAPPARNAPAAGAGSGHAPEPRRSTIPAPGTYPPPAAGSGLPPLIPPKVRAWGRQAASKSQRAAAGAPEKLRSWSRQAATTSPDKLRSLGRQAAGTAVKPRPWARRSAAPAKPSPIPVQPRPPATPPWAAPPPRPRRRRRLRRLTVLTVIGLLLLAYWLLPGVRQYPVTAVLPASFADLDLRDTAAGRRAAQKLADQLQETGADGGAFAGIYVDSRGKRVTVFGVTGLRLTPGSDVQAQIERLTGPLKLKDIEPFDLGEFGAHQQCGTGRLDGAGVVACVWADHGSLATVLLTRRSLADSAKLVAGLRETVLEPA